MALGEFCGMLPAGPMNQRSAQVQQQLLVGAALIAALSGCSQDPEPTQVEQPTPKESGVTLIALETLEQKTKGRSTLEAPNKTPSPPEAIVAHQRLAAQGDPRAAYRLGMAYLAGTNGVMRDPAAAREALEQAAEADHIPATMALAGMLLSEERERAIALYERLAEQGHCPAVRHLASLRAVPADPDTPDPMLESLQGCAADHDPYAAAALAQRYLDRGQNAQALRWLNRAARAGVASAMDEVLYLDQEPDVAVPPTLVAYVKKRMDPAAKD